MERRTRVEVSGGDQGPELDQRRHHLQPAWGGKGHGRSLSLAGSAPLSLRPVPGGRSAPNPPPSQGVGPFLTFLASFS